ncbi:MAG: gluconokinase [Coleofasciculaceae cyanobacterium]
MIVILMGVSGSGKSKIAKDLAEALGWDFDDADEFHSWAAKDKMSQGVPLNDLDRQPWLNKMQSAIDHWLMAGENHCLACSALKSSYRRTLRCDDSRVKLVYLQGSFELIYERLRNRQGHFMNENLLQSQFDTLEKPSQEEAIYIDISQTPQEVVEEIKKYLEV